MATTRAAAATLVPHSISQLDKEPVATSAPERQAGVLVFTGTTCWCGAATG
jgi:hypothetical protein